MQNDLFSLVSDDDNKMLSMNMWAILVPYSEIVRGVSLLELLKLANLRLDSHTFGFYEGKLKELIFGSDTFR